MAGCNCTTAKKLWPWVPKHHLPCTAVPLGRTSSAKPIRAELKVEQKQEKKKKCSTAESEIDPRGDESRTKTEKIKKCSTAESKIDPHGAESRTKTGKKEKMFYRRVRNLSMLS